MTLTTYINNKDSKVIRKNPTLVKSYSNIKPYNEMNILTPNVLLNYDSDIYQCNYAYLDTTGRYYYIKDITLIMGNKMVVSLSVDPLYSFADEILKAKVTVVRNQNIGSNGIVDDKYPLQPKAVYIESQIIGNEPLSTGFNYIIGINGG